MSRKDWKRPALTPLSDDLRRIRITVSYDGSAFHGFQRQDNGNSVQEALENALKKSKCAPITTYHGFEYQEKELLTQINQLLDLNQTSDF